MNNNAITQAVSAAFEGVLRKEPGDKISDLLAGSFFTCEQSNHGTIDKIWDCANLFASIRNLIILKYKVFINTQIEVKSQ